jgi:hypothetical protein
VVGGTVGAVGAGSGCHGGALLSSQPMPSWSVSRLSCQFGCAGVMFAGSWSQWSPPWSAPAAEALMVNDVMTATMRMPAMLMFLMGGRR